jgi:hypothetical protein
MATSVNQDDYIKTALRLPRHLHADASVAAQNAGRSLNAELIDRIGKSGDTAHFQRVIEQLTNTMKMERDSQDLLMQHVLGMFEFTIHALDEALLMAQHKTGAPNDIQRLIGECNQARGALKAFLAVAKRPNAEDRSNEEQSIVAPSGRRLKLD